MSAIPLLGAAVLLALTACTPTTPEADPEPSSSSPPAESSAPLEAVTVGGNGGVCADPTGVTGITVAIAIRNPGDEDAVITGLTADGVNAAAADAALAGEESAGIDLGVITSDDPPTPESDIPGWADRVDLGTAAVLPAGESRYVGFAVRLTEGAAEGWVTRVRVDYELPDVGVGATAIDEDGVYGFGLPDADGGFTCG